MRVKPVLIKANAKHPPVLSQGWVLGIEPRPEKLLEDVDGDADAGMYGVVHVVATVVVHDVNIIRVIPI